MKIAKTFRIETDNYSLRIPKIEDIPAIYSATKYEGFNDGILWDAPNTQEELLEAFKNEIKSWEEGKGYSFTIEKKGHPKLLGRISIKKIEEKDTWYLGFWTHPEEQGKGIMTEALSYILKFGFEKLSAKKIEAHHVMWNKAKEKVMKKNGFKPVKHIKKGFKKNGILFDGNLLAIHQEEWLNIQSKY